MARTPNSASSPPFRCLPSIRSSSSSQMEPNKKPVFPETCTKQGWLDIRTNPVKDWKRRFFVLINNNLLSAATPLSSTIEFVVPLENALVKKSCTLSFQIECGDKIYYIRAPTADLFGEWFACTDRATRLTIKDVYKLMSVLGQSDYSKVVAAEHRETEKQCAIKIITKRACNPRKLANEIQILKKLQNPFVVQLLDMFETKRFVYLVMEKCDGGELFDRILELDGGHYSERQSCELIRQIAQGVKYMHSMGIVHRDLKPENILCTSKENLDHIKIVDFGISKIVTSTPQLEPFAVSSPSMQTVHGSISYMAPEVLHFQKYNCAVDCWSIGVIMHVLLVGYMPFSGESDNEITCNILKEELVLEPNDWAHVSEQGKALVLGLLEKDPTQRKTVDDILKHTWIESSRGLVRQLSFNRARQRFSAMVARRKAERNSKGSLELPEKPKRRREIISSPGSVSGRGKSRFARPHGWDAMTNEAERRKERRQRILTMNFGRVLARGPGHPIEN